MEAYRVGCVTGSGATAAIHCSRFCCATRRSTALANPPAPELTLARTRSTVVLMAACLGTRIASSWWVPSRIASSTFASTLLSGRSTQAARIASYVPRRRSVPDASSVANAASRPLSPCWRSAAGSARFVYASSTRTALRTSSAASRGRSTDGRGPGLAAWRVPRGRGSAILEEPLDETPRRLGGPGVGDDLGQLVAVELPEPGLLDQDRVVPAEVVDGEEGGALVLDQRLLLRGGGGADDQQVVVLLAGRGVHGRLVRLAGQQEALAAHEVGRAVAPGRPELDLGKPPADRVDVVDVRRAGHDPDPRPRGVSRHRNAPPSRGAARGPSPRRASAACRPPAPRRAARPR